MSIASWLLNAVQDPLSQAARKRKGFAQRRPRGAAARHLRLEALEARNLMATLTWDGNGGNGKNTVWSAWSNWNPNTTPQDGDSLIFSGTRKLTNWNDLGLSLQNIIIRSHGFNIDGNAITLGSGGIHFVGGSTSHWGIPLNLAAAEVPLEVFGARTFYVNDVLYGSGGLGKYGSGTAVLSAASTYSGVTNIYAGTLLLNGSLASSDVVLGGGALTGPGTVRSITLQGGTLAPGAGIGKLTATHGVLLAQGTLQIEVATSGADQLLVTGGDVQLGGTLSLAAVGNLSAPAHRVYALVNNTGGGGITGAFANLADGQSLTLGGQSFVIRYGFDFGGDGHANDVVLMRPNTAPVALGETFPLSANGQLNVAAPGLLGNDYDADADALALSLLHDVEHGTLVLAPDGSFVYTPDENFSGRDSFTYWLDDGYGGTASATVNLDVVEQAIPVVGTNAFHTVSGAPVSARLRATDEDSPSLTYALLTAPRHGSVTVHPDGRFTYAPGTFHAGTATFTFTVSDGAATVTGMATVNVQSWNGRGIRPDVLNWILANNPGLTSNFLKTEKPDRWILLPDGRSTQIYRLDQFLDVNFKLDFKSRQRSHVNFVERQEDHLRKLLALPEFYYAIKDHARQYRIGGLGTVSSERAYSYLRNISKTIFVTASDKVRAPVGGGNGINAPSWAVWNQMNLFWHEACHVINIGHNSGGISGPIAGKLRQWDNQERWNYSTIDLNSLQTPN